MASFRPMTIDLEIRFTHTAVVRGPRYRLGMGLLALARLILKPRAVITEVAKKPPGARKASPGMTLAQSHGLGLPPFCRAKLGERCPSTSEGSLETCPACAAEVAEPAHDHNLAAWESEGGAVPPADERQHRVNLGLAGKLPCSRCHRPDLYLEPLEDRAGEYCGSCRDELIHGPILRRGR